MLNHHNHHHHHQMENYPRDLLQRFVKSSGGGGGSDENTHTQQQHHHHHHHRQQQHHHQHQQQQQQQHQEQVEQHEEEEEDHDEELELNLGLSLGGRFGVDKHARKKKLTRSSSVVGIMPLRREDHAPEPPQPAAYPAVLMRTSSLPTEAEEEWRKRKELQTLRRMEAKRRRSEKQRASRSERESSAASAGGITAGGGGLEDVEGASATTMVTWNRLGGSSTTVAPPPPPFGIPCWGVGGRQVVLSDVLGRGKLGSGSGSGGSGGFQGLFAQISSQGSADSQGGSSSSVSEMESKPFVGPSSCGEARSPASNQSLHERSSQDAGGSSGTKTIEGISRTSRAEVENPSKKRNPAPNKGREIGTNSMEDMPCVFTKGDGPNGRRIDGILYKYGKGEEVRIMCVCHGDFLSPAEFVKHAGGSDVAHPLKHIVVYPSASPFL